MKGKHIILTGFMGSGKSSIGIKLSYRLKRVLLDTDKLIEKKENKSISEIFETFGEAYFREQETILLEKLQEETGPRIISVGGGTPMREENRTLLKALGIVIYLQVTPETVYERLKGDTTRPLLQGDDPMEKIRTLLAERKELYLAGADVVIDCDGKQINDLIEEICEAVKGK